ncbi:MAG: DUF4347 domain-containing protein [Bacteroidia bacterium]|nr:DUF4347 domain-containing protein [Bacteroidia bacterium]
MKRVSFLIVSLLVCTSIFGQSFAVIDDNYQIVLQAKARYYSQQTYLVQDNQVTAANQIATALEGKEISNLHLFVSTEPGSIVFSNMTINADNLKENALILLQMASFVSENIIIHSPNVFSTELGIDFKFKLEQLTGLNFTVQ